MKKGKRFCRITEEPLEIDKMPIDELPRLALQLKAHIGLLDKILAIRKIVADWQDGSLKSYEAMVSILVVLNEKIHDGKTSNTNRS